MDTLIAPCTLSSFLLCATSERIGIFVSVSVRLSASLSVCLSLCLYHTQLSQQFFHLQVASIENKLKLATAQAQLMKCTAELEVSGWNDHHRSYHYCCLIVAVKRTLAASFVFRLKGR